MVRLTSTHKAQAYTEQRRTQWFRFIKCKKIKCAIKFMRALISNFHITSLIRKVDKNMNLLAIAIVLIGRYGGHKWRRFWFKDWMHAKHSLSVQVLG